MSDGFDVEIEESTDSHRFDGDETEGVYANETQADARGETLKSQRGDSSDEVDPRRLLRDPTLSELRWYYRRELGGTLVKKPMKDAFKNGFDFVGDNADEAQRLIEMPTYAKRQDYIAAHIMAEIKARRDGFALLFIGTSDTTDGIHMSPLDEGERVSEITHVDVKTIDDLTSSGIVHDEIQEGTGLEQDEYDIRDTGIVVDTRPMSQDFKNPIGYVLNAGDGGSFMHADRVVHYVWNEDVDGDYNDDTIERFEDDSTLGMWEGDSVLIPSYDLLKGISKGNWAVMQALFRNASHMYSVTLPPDANEEDLNASVEMTQNINAKSAVSMPNGWEMQQHDSGNELDPTGFYEVIFDQICANHEMTKSVLFGTQSGTVSGSETDIKNYYNKVERYRTNRGEDKIIEYLSLTKRMMDNRYADDYRYDIEFDWGPLFKVDRETKLQMLQTQAQALSTLLGQYIITPNEARNILAEEWAEIDLSDLTDEQMDILDRINLAQVGQGEWAEANDPSSDVPETTAKQGGQEGGRPEGARQESENTGTTPTDSAVSSSNDSVSDSSDDSDPDDSE